MPITITLDSVFPHFMSEEGTSRTDNWLWTLENVYSRDRGGSETTRPRLYANQLDRDCRGIFHRVLGNRLTFNDSTVLPTIKQYLIDNVYFSSGDFRYDYAVILMALNIYKELRNVFIPYPHRNSIDFICIVDNCFYCANKWEPKFHGRCLFNLAKNSYDNLVYALFQRNHSVFWNLIFNLIEQQTRNSALQSVRYRNQTTTQRQPRVTGRISGPAIQAFRDPQTFEDLARNFQNNYNSSNPLDQEYLQRDANSSLVYSTGIRDIRNMLDRSPNLPVDILQAIGELIIAGNIGADENSVS